MKNETAANVERHVRYLTETIGVRLAGSDGEKRAAAYVADQLRAAGAEAHMEEFPVNQRDVESELLEMRVGDNQWSRFPCSLLSNTPGTEGEWVQAPLHFFDSHTEYRRKDLSLLRGKAVVHLGTHIESAEDYRRLVAAEPAFVMLVDARYPAEVATADGMFPAYTRAHGAVPMVSVAYMHAWKWKAEGFTEARLSVKGGMQPSVSQNVVGTLQGGRQIIFIGGHHDTQADSVGADDNAVGVAVVIELTRLLSRIARKREIRLISFGAEEQLSVGSAEYVRRHREEIEKRGAFMFNFDAIGSLLGWSELTCNGSSEMAEYLRRVFENRGIYLKLSTKVIPYSDHFPFLVAGIPTAWLGRHNCESGRFFHHRPDDAIHRISPETVAEQIEAACEALSKLLQAETAPFPLHIAENQRKEAEKIWESLFGGWQGFSG